MTRDHMLQTTDLKKRFAKVSKLRESELQNCPSLVSKAS